MPQRSPPVLAVLAILLAPVVADAGEVLPREALFKPLLADPRWPHFSAAWHDYGGHGGLDDVAAVSLGDSFSFYQQPGLAGRWGVGIQAAVFAIFDLDAESKDLINADYFVGFPLSWQSGPWAAMARVYHQSSHLGDEYLLRTRADRIDLSYEAVDAKLSRSFDGEVWRLYGGVGYLVRRFPDDLAPWTFQIGAEWHSPWTMADNGLRPLAGLDLKTTDDDRGDGDLSARVGIEIQSRTDRDYRIQLMLEYFHGRNPNGQFYTEPLAYWGLGLHAYF